MKVQSTGLGKTVMEAEMTGLLGASFEGQRSMLMTMEAHKPLHWTIKVYMEPKDIRKAILMALKPSLIWRGFLALLLGRFTIMPVVEIKPPEQPPKTGLPGILAGSTSAPTRPTPETFTQPSSEVQPTVQPASVPSPRTPSPTRQVVLPGILAHPRAKAEAESEPARPSAGSNQLPERLGRPAQSVKDSSADSVKIAPAKKVALPGLLAHPGEDDSIE